MQTHGVPLDQITRDNFISVLLTRVINYQWDSSLVNVQAVARKNNRTYVFVTKGLKVKEILRERDSYLNRRLFFYFKSTCVVSNI